MVCICIALIEQKCKKLSVKIGGSSSREERGPLIQFPYLCNNLREIYAYPYNNNLMLQYEFKKKIPEWEKNC